MPKEHTNRSLSSIITRAGVSHFRRDEFGASARKEFDASRRVDRAFDRARDLNKVLKRNAIDRGESVDSLYDAARLVGFAEGVNALACLQCNGIQRRQLNAYGQPYVGGSWTEADETTEQETRAQLIGDMNAILERYGARVVHSYGDPRGHVVHIQFADKSSNRGGSESVWGL